MRFKEQSLWDRLRNNLQHKNGIFLERIENAVGSGIPDVLAIKKAIYNRPPCFIELKCATKMAALNKPLLNAHSGMRRSQLNWHLNWSNHYGCSYVLIGTSDTDWHWLVPGHYADKINGASVAQIKSISKVHGLAPEFWGKMEALL